MSALLLLFLVITRVTLISGMVQNDCIQPEIDKPSIVVRRAGPGAGLGNIMSNYASLLSLKVLYKFKVFVIKSERIKLLNYFPSLEIEAAEDKICNFTAEFQGYDKLVWEERERRILNVLRNLTNDKSLDFVVDENGDRKLLIPNEHRDELFLFTNSQ